MEFPTELIYTKDHEWATKQADNKHVITVGITEHAQEALGEIVYVELPEIGKELNQHDTFGVVESIKAVSDLYSPVTGKVVEVNTGVTGEPSLINSKPYNEGWLIKLEISGEAALAGLMSASEYKTYVEGLG